MAIKLRYIIFCLILLIPSVCFGTARSIYVDTSAANDAGAGTEGDPLKTIDGVNRFIDTNNYEGDQITVYFNRGDTWASDEPICVGDGGTNDHDDCDDNSVAWDATDTTTLTIDAYGEGALPKINLETMKFINIEDTSDMDFTMRNVDLYGGSSSNDYGNPVYIEGVTGKVIIDGVTGDGRGSGSASNPKHVIYLRECLGDIEIKNCNLHGFGPATNPSIGEDTHVFYIPYYTSQANPTTNNIKIHDNIIHSVNADCIHIGGFRGTGGTNIVDIYDNTFYNFGENAIDLKGCRHVYMHDNLIYRDGWGLGGSGSQGTGIVWHPDYYFTESLNEHHVYNNLFNGNDDGTTHYAGAKGGGGDAYIYGNKFIDMIPAMYVHSGRFHAYNNIIIATDASILSHGSTAKTFMLLGDSGRLYAYNNSMYEAAGCALDYGIYHHAVGTESEYKNNIIYMSTSDAYTIRTDSFSPIVDYNTHYAPNNEEGDIIYYNGTGYTIAEFADYVTASGADEKYRDPEYNDTATLDLSLDSTSLEIGSGYTTGSPYDYGIDWANTTWSPIDVATFDWGSFPAYSRGAVVPGFIISALSPTSEQPCDNGSSTDAVSWTSPDTATCRWSETSGGDDCDTVYASLDNALASGVYTFDLTTNCGASTGFVLKCQRDSDSVISNCLQGTHNVASAGLNPPPMGGIDPNTGTPSRIIDPNVGVAVMVVDPN